MATGFFSQTPGFEMLDQFDPELNVYNRGRGHYGVYMTEADPATFNPTVDKIVRILSDELKSIAQFNMRATNQVDFLQTATIVDSNRYGNKIVPAADYLNVFYPQYVQVQTYRREDNLLYDFSFPNFDGVEVGGDLVSEPVLNVTSEILLGSLGFLGAIGFVQTGTSFPWNEVADFAITTRLMQDLGAIPVNRNVQD